MNPRTVNSGIWGEVSGPFLIWNSQPMMYALSQATYPRTHTRPKLALARTHTHTLGGAGLLFSWTTNYAWESSRKGHRRKSGINISERSEARKLTLTVASSQNNSVPVILTRRKLQVPQGILSLCAKYLFTSNLGMEHTSVYIYFPFRERSLELSTGLFRVQPNKC